jgi:lysophospholipase L1-like esterase
MAEISSKPVSIGKKIIFVILTVLIFLILIETLLRISGIESRRESPFFLLLRVHEYPEYFRRHSTLFWELVPNKTISGEFIAKGEYQINSHGFRGEEFSIDKPGDQVRICCIGNSCTFGWEIPEGQTYAEQLEILLSQAYPDKEIEVINCGVPGYTSHQGLVLLKEKILDYNPDIITLSFGWNDMWGAGGGLSDRQQKTYSPFIIWLQNNLTQFATYRLIKSAVLGITEEEGLGGFDVENPTYRVTLDEYRQNLMSIHDIAVDNGITPIFLTSPAPQTEIYLGEGKKSQLERIFMIHEEYNNVIRDLQREKRYLMVPLATYFQNQPGFFDPQLRDYIHYNQRGHAYVAELIARYMRRYNLMERTYSNLGM